MTVRDYHRPTELKTAAELLRTGARPLLLGPRPPLEIEAEAVVDLIQLGLSYIREEADGLHIGALTPLQEIATSPLAQARANGILSQAAELSAHLGLRHIATLGGALLSNDGPPEVRLVLYTLNAHIAFLDTADAEISLAAWQENPAGQAPNRIRLPNSSLRISGALERIARTPKDQAILAAAVAISSNGPHIPRVCVAIGPNPNIYLDITRGEEPVMNAAQLTNALAELIHAKSNASSDYLASADYRREMAVVLAERAAIRAYHSLKTNNP